MDIHFDPYIHTNKYSNKFVVIECFSCFFVICYKPELIFSGILMNQQLVHCASFLVTGFVLFSRSRVPALL